MSRQGGAYAQERVIDREAAAGYKSSGSAAIYLRLGDKFQIRLGSNATVVTGTINTFLEVFRVTDVSSRGPIGFGLAGTDGSAGLYKAGLVPGYTGGAAIPAGFIGELRTFTNRTVTGTLGTWAVNTTPLDTLTPGVWLVSVGFVTGNSAATSYVEGAVSTNNSVDGTGIITSSSVVMSSIGTAANNWSSAMRPVVVNTATSQALYAKSFSEDAAQNATIYGSAIRIA